MTLDITRPEHREALRWACVVVDKRPHVASEIREDVANFGAATPKHLAIHALSSPSDSAAIVRAGLERCGVDVAPWGQWVDESSAADVRKFRDGLRVWVGGSNVLRFEVAAPGIPALVLRLLACTTKEEALAALGEVGR